MESTSPIAGSLAAMPLEEDVEGYVEQGGERDERVAGPTSIVERLGVGVGCGLAFGAGSQVRLDRNAQ